MEAEFNFEKLEVYQKALNFLDEVYKLTKDFPKKETFGISSQFIRAASSVALNIAEGAGSSNAQFNRYLQLGLNSTRECVVCSTIAKRQGYISSEQDLTTRSRLTELSKMIVSLQRYLKKN